jgi:UPF0755 protein
MRMIKSQMNDRNRVRTLIIISLATLAVLLIGSAALIRKAYTDNLKPVSSNNTPYVITIKPGSSTSTIADALKAKGVIRSDWAFEWYVRNHELRDRLKAGTYVFYESQSIEQIVALIVEGKEATDLVTILPAKRLDQVREGLIKSGFPESQVDAALDPSAYEDHPALTDKPKEANLEGYLYPESFQKNSETTASDIVRQSLNEMQLRLTPDIRQAFAKQGITTHQAIILASIVEKEVDSDEDRAQAAQVFLKRYREGISLGSDPTAFYGAIVDNKEPSVGYDSPYNTRMHKGLPPGPISNVTESSLKAIAYPAGTDWLYFVSGDDGRTHFSKTLEEHEELTRKYCTKLCGRNVE